MRRGSKRQYGDRVLFSGSFFHIPFGPKFIERRPDEISILQQACARLISGTQNIVLNNLIQTIQFA